MVDGKTTTRVRSSIATPRVAARRSTRFNTRASVRSFNIERKPMILEIGSTVLRVGYAEHFKPQHIIPIDPIENENKTESQWYSALSPLIQQVFDRLMCNPTTRRVVILHKYFISKSCMAALKQILWNKGVPAVVCLSTLDMVPVAQGWKRGLVVQVSREEAVCACHSDGQLLPFTYQSVTCGYKQVIDDETKMSVEWSDRMDQLLLNENNPNSLVVALLKCLEACPRDLRMYVISNIVFFGDGVALLPDLGRRVAKRVQCILEGSQTPLDLGEAQDREVLTMVPTKFDQLKPLADHLAVISCSPHRPDLISWVGSSLWVAVWNKFEDDQTRITWSFAPVE